MHGYRKKDWKKGWDESKKTIHIQKHITSTVQQAGGDVYSTYTNIAQPFWFIKLPGIFSSSLFTAAKNYRQSGNC
jgi:hypothetical protein